jgi:uncharacterized DUF497 family protein
VDIFSGLEWDEGNRAKCAKHGVSVEEIETMFTGEPRFSPDEVHSIVEQRLLATGRTATGRALLVVFTIREREDGRYVRPISAR